MTNDHKIKAFSILTLKRNGLSKTGGLTNYGIPQYNITFTNPLPTPVPGCHDRTGFCSSYCPTSYYHHSTSCPPTLQSRRTMVLHGP